MNNDFSKSLKIAKSHINGKLDPDCEADKADIEQRRRKAKAFVAFVLDSCVLPSLEEKVMRINSNYSTLPKSIDIPYLTRAKSSEEAEISDGFSIMISLSENDVVSFTLEHIIRIHRNLGLDASRTGPAIYRSNVINDLDKYGYSMDENDREYIIEAFKERGVDVSLDDLSSQSGRIDNVDFIEKHNKLVLKLRAKRKEAPKLGERVPGASKVKVKLRPETLARIRMQRKPI